MGRFFYFFETRLEKLERQNMQPWNANFPKPGKWKQCVFAAPSGPHGEQWGARAQVGPPAPLTGLLWPPKPGSRLVRVPSGGHEPQPALPARVTDPVAVPGTACLVLKNKEGPGGFSGCPGGRPRAWAHAY